MKSQESQMSHIAYRPDVDGLRAVAVSLVLIYHAFPRLLPGGYVGVDIFFVISGFLITSIILKNFNQNKFSFSNFYIRRCLRILPALLAVFIVVLGICYYRLFPLDYVALSKHILGGAGFVSNFLLWSESGYFDLTAESKPLLHLWSLAIEEQFYIFFPLIIFLIKKLRLNIKVCLSVLFILSLGYCYHINLTDSTTAFYLPLTRFWQILAGSLLASFSIGHHEGFFHTNKYLKQASSFFGLVLIVIVLYKANKVGSGFNIYFAIASTLAAVLLIFGTNKSFINRFILSNKLMVGIGLISYPLYLTHWPILVLNRIAYLNYPEVSDVLILIGLSVLSAYIIYKFIEHPIKKEKISQNTALTIIGACFLFCIGSGVYILRTDGAPNRLPHELLEMAFYKYDKHKEYREDKCFLTPTQKEFSDICLASSNHPKENVLLWGDSFAAHLYPGLKIFGEKNPQFTISQFTSSGCPPILNYTIDDRKNCEAVNKKIYNTILKTQPTTLIISANWLYYDRKNNFKKPDMDAFYKKLQETLLLLKTQYHGKIILVGQAPSWLTAAQRVILRKWLSEREMPLKTDKFVDLKAKDSDKQIEGILPNLEVTFIRPFDYLCDKDNNCVVIIPTNGKAIPTTFDDGHFTTEASEFFINSIKDKFI